ncbi:hypothetical protein GCM10009555_096570 [Acrocarpospora macrocephala]|uniref:DUF1468 domain-containing protein n=1 Tax=Acrocarpospora macrocephala TaxID=150177 RepID=A0A5M3WTB5_9ACTN|nr:tripartite tricarboxylate transporter TctB family protein [Acrocarpospora macrocephala]GES09398.1 hypothetical protein Amac_029940 [Acrocarpospora macrocephala]
MAAPETDPVRRIGPSRRRLRAIFPGVVLAVAVTYTLLSTTLVFWADDQPGAGFFPLILGVLFSAFALAGLVKELLRARSDQSAGQEASGTARVHARDCAVLAALALGYIVLFFTAGVLIATILFCVAAVMFLVSERRIRSILIVLPIPIVIVFGLNALTNGALISF